MKRISLLLAVMLCVAAVMGQAQTIQAGIFSLDANTVVVRAKVSGGSFTNQPFSNVVVSLFWETASGVTLGAPAGIYSIGKAGAVGTEGAFSYQKFASTPNVNITWANGAVVDLFEIPVTAGTGPALIEVRNPADAGANGDWYIEISGNDVTNTGTPFFVGSTELPLPVTLTSFAAKIAGNGAGVMLQWATASEVNNYGYTVQRKAETDETFADVAGAFIEGHGTTVEPQTYSYTDKSVLAAGKYEYRLKQQDLNGAVQYSQSVIVNVSLTDVAEAAPREFALMQNYPNPFNPTTMLKFSVPATGQATMKVYNMVGQEVVTLFEGVAEAGRYYAVPFNAANLASGVYFYRLVTENKTDVKRMLLVK
jgi:hypothetical protein